MAWKQSVGLLRILAAGTFIGNNFVAGP